MKSFILLLFVISLSAEIYSQKIELIYPKENSFVESFPSGRYLITWQGQPRSAVNISYTLNNGITWNKAMISQYSNDDYSALWYMPDTVNVICIIKVSGLEDSLNYDQNSFTIYSSEYNFISVNEIYMKFFSNGIGSFDPLTGNGGLYWPGGITATVCATYEDGLWWSGLVNGDKRANGIISLRSGTRGGVLSGNGFPSDPTDSLYRIWKIRKDWESLPPGADRDYFEFNYNNWPAEIGAPWKDVNGDNVFTRSIDEPKDIGDETLWYVSNDADTAKCLSVFGSEPMGLEFQVTTWGFESDNLKDVIFRKYKIINKGVNNIQELRLGYWSDDDLGNASDDYPGCDPNVNLGYIFNGDNDDDGNYGIAPPAIGRMILQGPIISSVSDSARFGYGWKKGFKNLGMTAYGPGFKLSSILPIDPPVGTYQGTLQVYYLLQGFNNLGDSLVNPHTGMGTIFALSGDPETSTGWYCGDGWPGGPDAHDVRSLISSGPFNMAPGDTNEIVIAVFLKRGTSNLNSVTKLKEYAAYLQKWYDVNMVSGVENADQLLPGEFSLSQNYPNPFNPSTKIRYQIPEKGFVTIKVFDILGKEIKTLVNEEKSAGSYELKFNASAFASGVYIYQVKVNDFMAFRKMVLMK